jgi:hypothetical protein
LYASTTTIWQKVRAGAHTLLEELAEASPLLIVGDLGMRKLAHTAADDFLELIMDCRCMTRRRRFASGVQR